MSKANVSPISVNAARDGAAVTAAFQAIADAVNPGVTTGVDAYNLAEQGIDWRALANNPHGVRLGQITETTRAAIAINAAFVTYVHGATSFRSGALPGTIDPNNVLRLTFLCQPQTTLANIAIANGADYRFRTAWNDGTTTTTLMEMPLKSVATTTDEDTWLFESWIVPASSKTVSWVEVQILNSQILRPKSSVLIVDKFQNVVVTSL